MKTSAGVILANNREFVATIRNLAEVLNFMLLGRAFSR